MIGDCCAAGGTRTYDRRLPAVHLLQVGLLLRDQASSQPPAAACVCTYAPRAIYVRASSMALRLDGESELLLDLACTLWS